MTERQNILQGLSQEQAAVLFKKHGPNILPREKGESWARKILRQFLDTMVLILIGAAIIAFFLGEEVDATIIGAVVVINAVIGLIQEWKGEKMLAALEKMVSPEAVVIRDGKQQKIDAKFLVPGDLIELREGDRIPADAKILKNFDLRVEEAALTGESVPVDKTVESIVFLGTAAVYGSAFAEVIVTGAETKFGKIAKLTLTTKAEQTPLQKELVRVGAFIGKLTAILVIGIFALDFLVHKNAFVESLLFSISVAVAAVPEGLPAIITIALALGVQRLAKQKAVVKKLSAAETLGATTVICSDKTGTITKNEMTVVKAVLSSGAEITFSGKGWNREGEIVFVQKNIPNAKEHLGTVSLIAQNCNDAKIVEESAESEDCHILGDPTEGALLIAVEKFKHHFPDFRFHKSELIHKFSFDATRKMMSTLHEQENGERLLFTKGAAEMLLLKCNSYYDGTTIAALTPEKRREFLAVTDQMSREALRVLAFAQKRLKSGQAFTNAADAEQELTFYGLMGMIDPPRDEVPPAVAAAHQAGVRVIMITGDNPETGVAIARKVGIITELSPLVLTGQDLKNISDAELTQKLFLPISENEKIGSAFKNGRAFHDILFARTAPEDKMRIVALLQQHGEVVAVTGDGVNDAPALKKSDIGVAMGITGTEVSKEAANIILLDDSFATIVTAISEGRKIFENIKKFLCYLFSGNISELIVIIFALIIAIPAPLSAVLILLINLGTDVLPAIALSFEKAEERIMTLPPRDSKQHLLQRSFVLYFFWRGGLLALLVLSVFFWVLWHEGWNWGETVTEGIHERARSAAFAALVFGQMFMALSARHFFESAFRRFFENKILLLAIALSVSFTLAVLYLPALNAVLRTAPLSGLELATVAISASLLLWAEEVRKVVMKQV